MRRAGKVTPIGKYQLLVELARGGMGIVHLAVVRGPAGFNKLVVIKELPYALACRPELVEMFLEEARIAARLNHPNIVQTNEVGSDNGRHYFVMEYLEGQSLRAILKATERGPRLPLPVLLHILIDALSGLQYTHELLDFEGKHLAIVHRDISPHNVFVTYAGTTKLVDFGLARAADTMRHTEAGILRGKLAYMAPEQVRGEVVDRRADVFAMGVMLWEAIAGRRMWRGLSELTVAERLCAGRVPSIRAAVADVSEDLARVCERALAPDRVDRYASAREMQADLELYLTRQGKQATARGVGILVCQIFREERDQMAALVQSQLQELEQSPADGADVVSLVSSDEHTPLSNMLASSDDDPFATIEAPSSLFMPVPESGAAPAAGASEPSELSRETATVQLRRRSPGATAIDERPGPVDAASAGLSPSPSSSPSPFTTAAALAPRGPAPLAGTPHAFSTAPPLESSDFLDARPGGPATAPFTLLYLAAVALLVTGMGIGAALGHHHVATASAASAAPPPHDDGNVTFAVRATPSGARILLDGRSLGTDAYERAGRRDAALHTLRIEADGYAPSEQRLVLDRSLEVRVALERLAPPTTPAPTAPERGSREGGEAAQAP